MSLRRFLKGELKEVWDKELKTMCLMSEDWCESSCDPNDVCVASVYMSSFDGGAW